MVDDNNDLMKATGQGKPIDFGDSKYCVCTEVKHNHQPSCQMLATEDDGLCKGCHDLEEEQKTVAD
jgi:hypothetical protein